MKFTSTLAALFFATSIFAAFGAEPAKKEEAKKEAPKAEAKKEAAKK